MVLAPVKNLICIHDEKPSSGSTAVMSSVMRQPLMNAMMYAAINVTRFWIIKPRTSLTAPRTTGASLARRDVSAPLVLASWSNQPTSM
jgi:hypothetical protein